MPQLSVAGPGRFINMVVKRSKVKEDEEGLLFSSSAVFSSSIDDYFLFPTANITYAVLRRHRPDVELMIEDEGMPLCPPGYYAERCCPHGHCKEYSINPIANSVFSCVALKCIHSLDSYSFTAGVYKDEDGWLTEGSFSLDLQLDAFLL